MSYYFQKCFFYSEKLGVRNECDRLSCANGKHYFALFFHRTNNESFYCLNGRQLTEYWRCVIAEQEAFCPGRCCKFDIYKDFNNLRKFTRRLLFLRRTNITISLFCGKFFFKFTLELK